MLLFFSVLFAVLDIDDLALLHSVLKEAMNHWEFIGINLMPHSEVEAIRINPTYAVYGSERYFLEMLVKFLQSPEKKCIRHLQLALEEADFQHLAANFLQQLNSSKLNIAADHLLGVSHYALKGCTGL